MQPPLRFEAAAPPCPRAASPGAGTLDPGGRRGSGCRETRAPPPWPSAIPSPCRLLHQHQVLSSHGSGTWGFERRVQRPGFWSWPCLLAQGTPSLWTSASSSVERVGANVWDQTSFPAPTTPATLPFFLSFSLLSIFLILGPGKLSTNCLFCFFFWTLPLLPRLEIINTKRILD